MAMLAGTVQNINQDIRKTLGWERLLPKYFLSSTFALRSGTEEFGYDQMFNQAKGGLTYYINVPINHLLGAKQTLCRQLSWGCSKPSNQKCLSE